MSAESACTDRPSEPLGWDGYDQSHPSAPAVQPVAIVLLESSVEVMPHPVSEGEDSFNPDSWTFDWGVAGQGHLPVDGEDGWHVAVIADLFVCRNGVHLTVAAFLHLRVREDLEELTSRDVEERYGYWSSHILWDYIAAEANRQLLSLIHI